MGLYDNAVAELSRMANPSVNAMTGAVASLPGSITFIVLVAALVLLIGCGLLISRAHPYRYRLFGNGFPFAMVLISAAGFAVGWFLGLHDVQASTASTWPFG